MNPIDNNSGPVNDAMQPAPGQISEESVNNLGQAPVQPIVQDVQLPDNSSMNSMPTSNQQTQLNTTQPINTPAVDGLNDQPNVSYQAPVQPPVPQGVQTSQSPVGFSESPKRKKGAIVGVVVGVILLMAIVAVGAFVLVKSNNSKQAKNHTPKDTKASLSSIEGDIEQKDKVSTVQPEAFTASYPSSLDPVCNNGAASNASAYSPDKAPYIKAFYHNDGNRTDSTWVDLYISKTKTGLNSNAEKVEQISLVACARQASVASTKSKVCEFQSSGKKVSLDLYSVKYNMSIVEAKTGKILKSDIDINGPALECPLFVTYNPDNPKLYARPDEGLASKAIKDFVNR